MTVSKAEMLKRKKAERNKEVESLLNRNIEPQKKTHTATSKEDKSEDAKDEKNMSVQAENSNDAVPSSNEVDASKDSVDEIKEKITPAKAKKKQEYTEEQLSKIETPKGRTISFPAYVIEALEIMKFEEGIVPSKYVADLVVKALDEKLLEKGKKRALKKK